MPSVTRAGLALVLILGPAGVRAQSPPPPAAAASAVGAETCATCHEDLAKQFTRSIHGAIAAFETRTEHSKCEACHGAGSLHADSGDATLIRSFKDATSADANQTCLACHRQDHAMEWAGSMHASSGVGCTSCHTIHQSRQVAQKLTTADGLAISHATAPAFKGSLSKSQPELCFDCHKEQRMQFMQSSRHPVREGRMTCATCHDPHGTNLTSLKTSERPNDLCISCHASKAGPFVFEHAPVQESCMTCHNPHGTVANNLLKQGEPFLCLQCHEMHFHSARIAPTVPAGFGNTFSNNPNGKTGFMGAFNTKCSNCHNKVHGSDLPSQGVTGGGKALTR